jgi:hypothetical protein
MSNELNDMNHYMNVLFVVLNYKVLIDVLQP